MRASHRLVLAAALLIGAPALFKAQSDDAVFRAQRLLEEGARLAQGHQADAAEPILRQAVLTDPTNALAYYYLGSVEMALKKYEAAREALSTSLGLDEKKPALGRQNLREAKDALGLSLAFLKRYDQSLKVYREAVAKDPDYAPFSYNMACVCALSGDRTSALQALALAMDADAKAPDGPSLPDPSRDEDLKGLWGEPVFQCLLIMNQGPQPTDGPGGAAVRAGARLLAGGDAAGAVAKGRAAVAAAPGDSRAWFFLGGALERASQEKEAAEAFGKALASDAPPNAYLSKLMLRYCRLRVGEAALAEGRFDEAAEAFEAAVKLDPYWAWSFYGLARARAGQGDKAKAGEALKRAFALKDEILPVDKPLPDPAKDPAFAKWAQDKEWLTLVQGL